MTGGKDDGNKTTKKIKLLEGELIAVKEANALMIDRIAILETALSTAYSVLDNSSKNLSA